MKLLILGGTVFLGRHIVNEALAAGHEVTLFNRGKSNAEIFGDRVETILGDRSTDLDRLGVRYFDACIDPSGYLPHLVEAAARRLADHIERYAFISSISVYPQFHENLDESGTLDKLPDGVDQSVYEQKYYGAFKVLCEAAAEQIMPGRVINVRSGLIVGPWDPTNRFTYWPARVAEGGDMLAPAPPDLPIQFIDARDQAIWILDQLQKGGSGIYNVTGPPGRYTLADLISAANQVLGSDARAVWVDPDFLVQHEVAYWMGLPLWLPETAINMSRVCVDKALSTGLTLRPIEETIADTLDWYRSEPVRDWPAGISRETEQQLLQAWQAESDH